MNLTGPIRSPNTVILNSYKIDHAPIIVITKVFNQTMTNLKTSPTLMTNSDKHKN